MRVRGDHVVVSVDDVAGAAACEWRLVCKLRRAFAGEEEPDPSPLGAHLQELHQGYALTVLDHYYEAAGVWEPTNPHGVTDLGVAGRGQAERSVWADGCEASVVFGESLQVGDVEGVVPLAVRTGAGPQVQLPRFSSHVRERTRVTLGGFAWLLLGGGVRDVAPVSLVLLAAGRVVPVDTAEAVASFVELLELTRDLAGRVSSGEGPDWWEVGRVCGSCPDCAAAIAATDDVLAVPGIGLELRRNLHARGVRTRRDLVRDRPTGVTAMSLTCADLQVAQVARPPGPHGPRVCAQVDATHPLLAALPDAAPGDVYLDIEADSLWGWTPSDHSGLVYLAGMLIRASEGPPPSSGHVWAPAGQVAPTEARPEPAWEWPAAPEFPAGALAAATGWRYVSWWAHSLEEERALIRGLLTWLRARRAAYPSMRVYHYSKQDPLYLRRLARRHGLDMREVTDLIGRAGPFTDLFDVVAAAVRTGQPGLTLKDMEPLYMGPFHRGALADGASSVVLYEQARTRLALDRLEGIATVPTALADLAAYNEYDCVSALLLHRWLAATRVTQ